jgi:D-3-phosphoglycerate dehydrogenase / 2-oxoglutarate reductase
VAAWKILITDGLEENGLALMRESAQVDDRTGISADELLQVIGDYDALIVRGRTKVTPAVFKAGEKLKVVGRAGVGVDNIDLPAAKECNVMVVNSPYATTVAVAELAMALLLSLARETPRADSAMKAGKWLKKDLEGVELYRKTLGIIGFGRIGSTVARRAEAFEMHTVCSDPKVTPDSENLYGCTSMSLDELLAQSDFITIHVPLNAVTRGMIGREQFALMKDGVRIVDVSRGGVIDQDALLEALESGKVAAAALDVFPTEPPGLTPLAAHPRVICTPHIGAQTVEAQQRAAYDIASEIMRALNGKEMRWRVA